MRKKLCDAFYVCYFKSLPGQAIGRAGPYQPADEQHLWWLMGLVYQKPWSVTFAVLTRVAVDDDARVDIRWPERAVVEVERC